MHRLSLLSEHFVTNQTSLEYNEFGHVKARPADPILGLTNAFKADKDPKKVNLGIGAYRDNNGKPYIFPVVKKVELEIVNDKSLDKEYAVDGVPDFLVGSRMVAFGWEHPDVTSGRVAT